MVTLKRFEHTIFLYNKKYYSYNLISILLMALEDWWRAKKGGGLGLLGKIVVFERSTVLKNQLSQLFALKYLHLQCLFKKL